MVAADPSGAIVTENYSLSLFVFKRLLHRKTTVILRTTLPRSKLSIVL